MAKKLGPKSEPRSETPFSTTTSDGQVKGAQLDTIVGIVTEVKRARTKFPGNKMLLAALTEEVGELAKALLQKMPAEEIRKEAIQVCAVAVRIIEEGDASFADLTAEESLP